MSTAMRLHEPGPLTTNRLTRDKVELPPLAPHEVRIEVAACAVCRTDLQLVAGDLPARTLPITPGHQIVGTITAIGSVVQADRLGNLVGVAWLAGSCGKCRFCLSGRENLCEFATFTGWDRDGGYATEVVANSDCAFDLPMDFLPAAEPIERAIALAPLLCGGVIGYRSLAIAGIGPDSGGQRLGLYGYGASATLVLQVARFWDVEVSVVTRSPTEARRALDAGASWAGTYDDSPPHPLDAAITFAPAGDVVVSALKALDRGGTVAVNAIHLDRVPELDYDDLWWERSIKSVANVTRADVTGFLALVPEAGIQTVRQAMPLTEANTALRRLEAGDVTGSLVLVP